MRPPVRRVLSVLEFISSSAVLMRGGAEERLACKGSRRDVPASGIKDHASALSNDPRRLLYGRLSEKTSTRTAEKSARSGPITPRWRTDPCRSRSWSASTTPRADTTRKDIQAAADGGVTTLKRLPRALPGRGQR